jgi:hypothetical protein
VNQPYWVNRAPKGAIHVRGAGIGKLTLMLGNDREPWHRRQGVTMSHVELRSLITVLELAMSGTHDE